MANARADDLLPTLRSRRFVLRPVARGDAPALMALFGDADSMRYWSRGPFRDEAELADYLDPAGWSGRSWAIAQDETAPAIGRLVAVPGEDPAIFEVGYAVVPAWRGQGVAREALSALIDHLFDDEGARRLFSDVDPANAASNRVVEALGFMREGRLRATWVTHIGTRDSEIWGLLADEWAAIQG